MTRLAPEHAWQLWLAALVVFAAVAALVVAQWRLGGVISAPGGRRNSS